MQFISTFEESGRARTHVNVQTILLKSLFDAMNPNRPVFEFLMIAVVLHRLLMTFLDCVVVPLWRWIFRDKSRSREGRGAATTLPAGCFGMVKDNALEILEAITLMAAFLSHMLLQFPAERKLDELIAFTGEHGGSFKDGQLDACPSCENLFPQYPKMSARDAQDLDFGAKAMPAVLSIAHRENWLRILVWANHVFMLCDLWRHFAYNIHFKATPRTILRSLAPVGYLVISALTILVCYVSFIVLDFGAQPEAGFDSVISTLENAFQIFLGDLGPAGLFYEYAVDDGVRQVVSLLLFLTWMFVGAIVALNIFLSIVMDTYSSVLEEIQGEEDEKSRRKISHDDA